jgi:C1A family cysteine protease
MSVEDFELRLNMGEVRDQGPRPTCLSFSLSETHCSAAGSKELFSPESLHSLAALRAQQSRSYGLSLIQATDGLRHDGQTTESAWPYNSHTATLPECAYYCATAHSTPFAVATVRTALEAGFPLSLIINVDVSFFACSGNEAVQLIHNSQVQGRHAVVICGYSYSLANEQYLIKNSWGIGWGKDGYAWLTSEYIQARSPQLLRI